MTMNGDAMDALDGSQYPKLAQWERQFAEQLAAKQESEQTALAEKKVGSTPIETATQPFIRFFRCRQKPSASLICSTVASRTAA